LSQTLPAKRHQTCAVRYAMHRAQGISSQGERQLGPPSFRTPSLPARTSSPAHKAALGQLNQLSAPWLPVRPTCPTKKHNKSTPPTFAWPAHK
jgi:hypothetical protein